MTCLSESLRSVFINTANIINDSINKGVMHIEIIKSDDIFNHYLNSLVELLKKGCTLDYMKFHLDYKLAEVINRNNLTEAELKELFIARHLGTYIIEQNADAFLSFTKYFCDYVFHDELYIILKEHLE